MLPLFGDRKPIPFLQSEFDRMHGYFSPNGRWLAYVSSESGQPEVYIRPFPDPTGILSVSTGGGSHPRWRRDGKELFYISPQGRLMVVDINEGERLVAGVPKALFQMRLPMGFDLRGGYAVTSDGQRFLFAAPPAEASSPNVTVVLNWPAVLKKGRVQ